MEEENRRLHQQVSSFMSDEVSVSITTCISLFFTHRQVRQLEEEKAHSQQRTREMRGEIHGLQQQVSLHITVMYKLIITTLNNQRICVLMLQWCLVPKIHSAILSH